MGDLILKYELDLTGRHPNNRVLNEEHTLTPGVNRSAVMRYGAYYTQDMIVRDGVTGAVLDKGTQYMAVMYWSDPSERSGLEVCVALVITDPSVSNTINVDVNYVGGLYQNVAPVIIEAIDNLNLDDRPIMWGDLLGRPDAFPPSAHLHDLGDIYGFEYLVEQLAAIREAILYGDVASHEELKRLIEDRYDDAVRLMNIIDDRLTIRIDDHLADKNNPHGTTKAQVGLGNVQNYNVATEQQAIAGTANDRYMTALRVAQAINTQALLPLNDHINNKDNPHEVTKTQVGLSNVQNYGISNEAQAVAGTLNTVYMTPLRVSQAISNQAIIPLQAHINDKNNPHSVTKAQVGLGSVQNYGISSETDAAAGTLNNSYMTPLRVAQAITQQAGLLLQGHIDDKANPHNVTKAQVGLGSVQDYGVASEAQAIAGTANNRYMTPLRVAQAITSQAGSLLQSHVDDKNNPHNVTKAQVGLGNVQNYNVATQEEAIAGVATNKYMTPLRVAQVVAESSGASIQQHVNNTSNPHNVTKTQVGLGNVQNYGISSETDAAAGTLNNSYMTPLRVAQAITKQAGLLLQGHISDTTNPHNVTKSQVGLGNVQNYSVATQQEAIDGVVTNKYMTPQGVAQAITQQTGSLLQGHISDTTNPHNVTKSQVGLGNVQNYGTASNAQAAAGTASNLYVTPAGLKHAFDTGLPDSAKRGEIALSHLNSTTNTTQGFITGRRFQAAMREYTDAFDSSGNYASLRARGTTKADVGLGNVDNYGRSHYDSRYYMSWVCIGQGNVPSGFLEKLVNTTTSYREIYLGTMVASVNALNHGNSDGGWTHRIDQYMVRFTTADAVAPSNATATCAWGLAARNFRRTTQWSGGNRLIFDIYGTARSLVSLATARWELYRMDRNLPHTYNSSAAGGSAVNFPITDRAASGSGSSGGTGGSTGGGWGGGEEGPINAN